jgi:hypothetical protein
VGGNADSRKGTQFVFNGPAPEIQTGILYRHSIQITGHIETGHHCYENGPLNVIQETG